MPVDPYPGVPSPNTLADAAKMRAQLDALFSPVVPRVRVTQPIDSSAAHGAVSAMPFANEFYDTDSMHSTVSNTSRLTINTAGVYHFVGQVYWDPAAAGARAVSIRKNGSSILGTTEGPGQATYGIGQIVTCEAAFSVGDYVELMCAQTSGGALLLKYYIDYSPIFSGHFVSA